MQKKDIENLVNQAIKSSQKEGVFPDFKLLEVKIEVPENKSHGDFSTSAPMVLAKIVKKSPMEIADRLVEKLKNKKTEKFFDKIEAIKPGFINFCASEDLLMGELRAILKEKNKYGTSKEGKGKTMVIDYSSPNIAKSFGVGHLRSTIIGQAIYNLYRFLGWKCIGDNHLGDWGTQFGKLIVAIRQWSKKGDRLSIAKLENLYVRFHEEAEKNPFLIEEARKQFHALEKKEKNVLRVWKQCVDISLKEFKKIYNLLNIKIDYTLGESFYGPMLQDIIMESEKKKISQKSQGALIIKFPSDVLPPAILLKSDGATTYLTRDLAAVKYRLKKWKPNIIIYEVGADQSLHLRQLFFAVELLGWAKRDNFFHVAHGLMRTAQGKFSTRKGQTIHLEEILKEAIEKAKKIILQSNTAKNLNNREINKLAKQVGIGAVKYNDLKQHPGTDIIFDWEKILNLKGNSGPYLQYAFARCKSIIRKNKEKITLKDLVKNEISEQEKDILRIIMRFKDVVKESAEKFSPNLICNFAFTLAKSYSAFYDTTPILKTENAELRRFRLALTMATSQVLENALHLLGIEAPEKM